MKKLILVCSALLIGSFSVSAMQQTTLDKHRGDTSYQNHEERIKKMESHLQLDNCYYDHLSSYAANMYLNAEFLYWAAENEGFYVGSSAPGDSPPFTEIYRDFDYGPGVRIGLGFKPPIDWDLYLSWTYFKNTSKEKFAGELLMFNTPVRPLGRIESSLTIKYNILDLEFGRPYHIGQTFSVRTHVGLRGGWIKNNGRNDGYDAAAPTPSDQYSPTYFSFKEKYWLIGPRAGFAADLFFSKDYGFSLYGNFSGALMYGKLNSNFITVWTNYPALDLAYFGPIIISDKNDVLANMQCALGLAWGDFITDDDSVALCIRAGWEFNYWWDMYNPREYFWFESDGDTSLQHITEAMYLQGLVVSARLDF